jgi:hypothetical protein
MAKLCRCGCGEPVSGLRRSKQYVDDAHRKRHRRAQEKEAAAVDDEPEPDPLRDWWAAGTPDAVKEAFEDDRGWRSWW